MSHVLVIEDEEVIRQAVEKLLRRNGHTVTAAGSVDEAVQQHEPGGFDLIIADMRLPGSPGTAIIAQSADTPVLIMTSYASVSSAVEAMKLGAADYIAKPFDHDELLLIVDSLLTRVRLARRNAALQRSVDKEYPVRGIVGSCASMQDVFERIRKVAPNDTTVLVTGESGTGKELVARAIHDSSQRRDGPFVAVNCATIPEALIESELFGHERGAFTGAHLARDGLISAADGGTLFLDEIAELSLSAQAGMLRVLQEGEVRRVGSTTTGHVDIRLVAASHRNLGQRVVDGLFREDLLFRLRVMEILLPPLRDRGPDIKRLAEFLLNKVCERLNRPAIRLSEAALETICAYPWPGNVRELENALERAAILADGSAIEPELLAITNPVPTDAPVAAPPDVSLDEYFVQFVRANEGRSTETELAKRLGISRKTLWERRQKLGIPRKTQHGLGKSRDATSLE